MSGRSNWGHGNHHEKRKREGKFRTYSAEHPEERLVSTSVDSNGAVVREVHPSVRAMIDAKLAAKREGEEA